MEKFERGTTMRITAVCTDPDTGAAVDPTSMTCVVEKPDGTEISSGAMSGSGGTYTAEVALPFTTDLGYYIVKVYGTYDTKQVANVDRVKVVQVI